jgi:hypothetical protein
VKGKHYQLPNLGCCEWTGAEEIETQLYTSAVQPIIVTGIAKVLLLGNAHKNMVLQAQGGIAAASKQCA